MPLFNYSAKDGSGKKTRWGLEAASSYELVHLLRDKGLTVISVEAKAGENVKPPKTKYGNVKLGQLSVFYRQLATMLEAGVPIVNSIEDIADQS